MAEFRMRLKELREEKRLNQKELGELVGVAGSTLAGYEAPSKHAEPGYDILIKIADVLETSLDYLLGRSDVRGGEVLRDPFADALANDAELLEFWLLLRRNEDLRILCKRVRDLDSESIRRIVRVVEAMKG